MSTTPSPSDPEPDDDGFPQDGDGTETATFMAGGRFSGGPITRVAVPGPVVGELITRLSKLYSALEVKGANLARAVADYPYYLRKLEFAQSVDVMFKPERSDAAARMPLDEQDPLHAGLETIAKLIGERDEIETVAAGYGSAVTNAYRQLASLLGEREITADFFLAVEQKPDESTFVRLAPDVARAHAEALSDRRTLHTETVSLTGLLSVLDARRSVFKLDRPDTLTTEYRRAWTEAVRGKRTVEGELTDEAATDIRRLNAWNQQVTVEVELTHVTAPTTTSQEEIESRLLRVTQVHGRLDDPPAASMAA